MAEEKTFDPSEHMMNLKGRDYLPVAARVLWFRRDHPIESGWAITTTCVEGGFEKGFAAYQCRITDPEGRVVAMGTNVEDKGGFGDFVMKAETGSIGRALAACGYGTMAALDEGDVVDAPAERAAKAPLAPAQRVQPNPEAPALGNQQCAVCGKGLTPAVTKATTEAFGRPLCRDCVREASAMGSAKVPAGQVVG